MGKRLRIKARTKDWEVGDVILPFHSRLGSTLIKKMADSGISTLKLVGWDEKNVYFRVGDQVFMEDHGSVQCNKSAYWRENYSRAKKFMGAEPDFTGNLKYEESSEQIVSATDSIDGEPIETMNETLCQIYLNQALEEGDLDLAAKLRKRLERFK